MSGRVDKHLREARAAFVAAIRRYGALGTDEAREEWVRATKRLAEVEASSALALAKAHASR